MQGDSIASALPVHHGWFYRTWRAYLDSVFSGSEAYRRKRGGHWTLSQGFAGVDPQTWERDGRGDAGKVGWYEETRPGR